MKFCKFICLFLGVILLIGPAMAVSAENAEASVITGCHSVNAQFPIGGSEKITDTAKAAILYERSTGTLLYAYQPDKQIYPSSMVKLMTAIVAMEYGELDQPVTVTRSALDSVAIGSVSAGLLRNEQISLKDLLYCMMVASANDAAAVIAEHIAGSQEAFVQQMNEKAIEIGCTGTNFTNAHGLHDNNSYTTARDILRILEYGLQNPYFREMFEAESYTVPATNLSAERTINTSNLMGAQSSKKYYDERVTGGKTGATEQAGRCLAVSADVGDMELIGIVMGAKETYSEDGSYLERFGSFEEMAQLLDHAEKTFECRQLFYENQVIAQYSVTNGSNNAVTVPANAGYCVLPKDIQASQLRWEFAEAAPILTAPVAQNQVVTTLEVWYGNICLATTDLVAMNPVSVYEPYEEPKSATDEKNEEAHGEILARILGGALAVAVAVLVGMFLIRILQTVLIKARLRRRRKNRRRNRNARME